MYNDVWGCAEILPAIVLEILPQAAGPDGKIKFS